MGIDAYLLLVRNEGVSRAEVSDLLDRPTDRILWFADRSFAVFTGVRFYEWENGDKEKRLRLALGRFPNELFPLVEPYALVYPDVADFLPEDTLETVIASGATIRIDFEDYTPNDPRLQAAAELETKRMVAAVKAMMAFSEYLRKDATFREVMKELAEQGDIEGMVRRTRSVPELAPIVDELIAAKHFELFASQI